MPKVGGKQFAYTASGKQAADAYAQKTGQAVQKKHTRQAKMHSVTAPKNTVKTPTGWRINKAENGFVVHTEYPLGEMLRLDGNDKPLVFANARGLLGYLKDSVS
jgi:hypothetical protein